MDTGNGSEVRESTLSKIGWLAVYSGEEDQRCREEKKRGRERENSMDPGNISLNNWRERRVAPG